MIELLDKKQCSILIGGKMVIFDLSFLENSPGVKKFRLEEKEK